MIKTKVLVVDDSAFMRKALKTMLESEGSIEVLGTAINGRQAVDKVMELQPDIVTMDIEMPVMSGIEALRQIMRTKPTPVIMISSLTTEGAQATIEALSIGAIDFIPKHSELKLNQSAKMKEDLVGKIKSIAQSSLIKSRLKKTRELLGENAPSPNDASEKANEYRQPQKPSHISEPLKTAKSFATGSRNLEKTSSSKSGHTPISKLAIRARRPQSSKFEIAVIGISTGGPMALHHVIPRLPKDLPVGLLIVQHMPPKFTKSLANRLNGLSHVTVSEAADHDQIRPGHVLIAPGGYHMFVARNKQNVRIREEPASTLHRPSVDITVKSVVDSFKGNCLGVIMTGMGRDGCDSLELLHNAGGYILAQDEASSVVYGMPKAVVDKGFADEILALEEIPAAIAECLGKKAAEPLKSS